MKGYFTFPKAPRLEPCHIHIILEVGVLHLFRDAVGVFYSPSRLGLNWFGFCSCVSTTVRLHHKDLKIQEKKLDGNYTRMLHVVLNKSWKTTYFPSQKIQVR